MQSNVIQVIYADMKGYTDLEQSKKLAEILPLESADMVYFGIHQGMDGKYHLSGTNTEDDVVPIYKNLCTKVFVKATESDITCQLPCWTLASLLDVLPLFIEFKGDKYYLRFMKEYVEYANDEISITGRYLHTTGNDNLVDACYEIIIKLHELNLL